MSWPALLWGDSPAKIMEECGPSNEGLIKVFFGDINHHHHMGAGIHFRMVGLRLGYAKQGMESDQSIFFLSCLCGSEPMPTIGVSDPSFLSCLGDGGAVTEKDHCGIGYGNVPVLLVGLTFCEVKNAPIFLHHSTAF